MAATGPPEGSNQSATNQPEPTQSLFSAGPLRAPAPPSQTSTPLLPSLKVSDRVGDDSRLYGARHCAGNGGGVSVVGARVVETVGPGSSAPQ